MPRGSSTKNGSELPGDRGDGEGIAWRSDAAALLGLLALSALFVAFSWRKWPDALIDFGREIYTPWRMAEGAVLYRDVNSYYGPLSAHLNAVLFRLFGPGLIVLVWANLVVFAASLALMYTLCRRAWGRVAAFGGCAVFVSVFGFTHVGGVGNYNFATPYSHASTHGFLVCLGLVAALDRWARRPTVGASLASGALLGLTAVLKPEFMLAGGVVTAAVVVWRRRHAGWPAPSLALTWLAGLLAPSAGFAVHFARHVPWTDAIAYAGTAWLNVVGPDAAAYAGEQIQAQFLGVDEPAKNLALQLRATAIGLVVLAALGGLVKALERIPGWWLRLAALVAAAGSLVFVALEWIEWLYVGRVLPGFVALALLVAATGVGPGPATGTAERRSVALWLTLLAGLLVLRMALNGRIYHYGFYQAALAGVVITALLLAELPRWLSPDHRTQHVAQLALALLIGTGAVSVARKSTFELFRKDEPIGHGRDRFFGFPPEIRPRDTLVNLVLNELRELPPTDTLVVLPEGTMINYLARRPSPVPYAVYFTSTTHGQGEARVVRNLEARPPDAVVVISRPLPEYGITRWGEKVGSGRLIMDWLDANYEMYKRGGGDPLDQRDVGAALFRRRR